MIDIIDKFTIDNSETVIVSDNHTISYSDIYLKIKKLEYKFKKLNLKEGDRVLVQSTDIANTMALFYATQVLGLVFIPIDIEYKDVILTTIVELIEPQYILDNQKIELILNSVDSSNIESGFNRLNLDDDRLSVILFTSGTTGKPKGIMLSNKSIYSSARVVIDNYKWDRDDIILNLADIHTMSGLRNTLIAPLLSNSRLIKFDISKVSNFIKIIELILEYKATILLTSPVVIKQLNIFNKKINREDISSLNYIMTTGNHLSKNDRDDFCDAYSIPIYNYYGLTETAGVCIGFTPKDKDIDSEYMGYPLGSEIDIIDRYNNSLGENSIGRLKIKNSGMIGYYKSKKLTQNTLIDGWFYTQDLVLKSFDNKIKLIGRVDNAFNSEYGELIYPEEIEAIINLDKRVFESCVFEFKSKLNMSKIGVAIVLVNEIRDKVTFNKGINELIERKLGKRKMVSNIWIVDDLPKGNYGKLKREKIKKRYAVD